MITFGKLNGDANESKETEKLVTASLIPIVECWIGQLLVAQFESRLYRVLLLSGKQLVANAYGQVF